MPNKHLKIPQAICELVGQDLKDSPEWKRQISPGQNRFSFGCVGGEFNTGKMAPTWKLHRRRAQQKDNSGHSSSLHPEAT